MITADGVLAVLHTRGQPVGSVVFNPDGSGTVWTDEVRYERSGEGSMDAMGPLGVAYLVIGCFSEAEFEQNPPLQGAGAEIPPQRLTLHLFSPSAGHR